eukprot:2462481-Amphidinium_carterae.1
MTQKSTVTFTGSALFRIRLCKRMAVQPGSCATASASIQLLSREVPWVRVNEKTATCRPSNERCCFIDCIDGVSMIVHGKFRNEKMSLDFRKAASKAAASCITLECAPICALIWPKLLFKSPSATK